jgi:F0F1-type ATP synthase assembly protein I
MFNIASILIGVIALGMAAFAFIPLLGWMNWFVIPVAIVGMGVGIISKRRSGTNLNIAVIIICALRLMLGGGIF